MIVTHNPIFHALSILMNNGECFECGIKIDRKTCDHYYGERIAGKPKTLLADYCNKCGFKRKPPRKRRHKPKPVLKKKVRKRVATRGRRGRRR